MLRSCSFKIQRKTGDAIFVDAKSTVQRNVFLTFDTDPRFIERLRTYA